MGAYVDDARALGMSGPTSIVAKRLPDAVHLVPLPASTVDRVASLALRNIAWVNDGWCGGRALAVAQSAAWHSGMAMGTAAGRAALEQGAGISDAVAGAVAVVAGPLVVGGGSADWSYHAAGVMQRVGDAEPLVVDGVLFRKPVPLSAWTSALGLRAADAEIRHPWQLQGLSMAESVSGASERIRENLVGSLRSQQRMYGEIRNPLLTHRNIHPPERAVASARAAAFEARTSRYDRFESFA